MIDTNDLASAFARNANIIKMQTQGLSHEDSMRQPPFHGNCLNWVLGHLAMNRNTVLEALGESPITGADGTRYKRGSDPLTEEDAGSLRMETLLDWIERAQNHIALALGRVGEADLARTVTIGDRQMTLGQRLFFLYFHESYHVGQTELFRQLAVKDDKII